MKNILKNQYFILGLIGLFIISVLLIYEKSQKTNIDNKNTLKIERVNVENKEKEGDIKNQKSTKVETQDLEDKTKKETAGLPPIIAEKDNQDLIYQRAGTAKYSSDIYTKIPSTETFKLAGNTNRELSHWLQVLPEADRNKNRYIVIPSQGLIVPLNYVNKGSDTYNNFIKGNGIDLNFYLETGAFEIPGTSKNNYGEPGNKAISGHSSFYSNEPGRYKTHFQKIIAMDPGEQIWVYQKNDKGNFDRYIYITKKSYNTKNNDISILKGTSKSTITLFTCTPIGGITGRWVVRGEFIKKD